MSAVIRRIAASDYAEAAQVWRTCFPEDSDEFVEYYFAERTRPEFVLAAFVDGMIVSNMHIIPQELQLHDCTLRMGFISGVATLLAFRRIGLASELFATAFEQMRTAEFDVTVLQPFDHRFYAKYGYVPFVRRKIAIMEAHERDGRDDLTAPDAALMERAYNAYMAKYQGGAVRTPATYASLLREFSLPGARAAAAGAAYALLYEDGDGAVVHELCGDVHSVRRLLSGLSGAYSRVAFPLPLDCECALPSREEVFSVICPLNPNAEALLRRDSLDSDAPAAHRRPLFAFDRY
ncbi:MAG: GNAT family N-acetyltransferase [Clostridia bacterium]|nr:GNAT family N-acetyltransferase [Clostridia bacterium]